MGGLLTEGASDIIGLGAELAKVEESAKTEERKGQKASSNAQAIEQALSMGKAEKERQEIANNDDVSVFGKIWLSRHFDDLPSP